VTDPTPPDKTPGKQPSLSGIKASTLTTLDISILLGIHAGTFTHYCASPPAETIRDAVYRSVIQSWLNGFIALKSRKQEVHLSLTPIGETLICQLKTNPQFYAISPFTHPRKPGSIL
jgi:hypothetical protein